MSYHRRTDCRGCGNTNLVEFLSLGPTPLANSNLRDLSEAEDEASYPLDLFFCPTCSLVQILDVVAPDVLFRDYIYVTGTSDTIAEHNVEYARALAESEGLGADDLVIEVASNDGSLLRAFQAHGVRTLGIEPATNIAEIATAAGVETVNEFFDADRGRIVRESHGPARVVIGNNVFAHVDEPADFLVGCRNVLGDGGVCSIEVPYLGELLERREFDTVYHEHLSYFSVTALMHLYERAGLYIERIQPVSVHGGSIRILARPAVNGATHSPEVVAIARQEADDGLCDAQRYHAFARDVAKTRDLLLKMLERWRKNGASVAAYGAPAKGNTLLNYCGITTDLLPYTVDRSPLKVGLYTPGAHLPILPVSALVERQPDYVLILAWNFADEIARQQDEYFRNGGRFAVPVPEPRILMDR